MTSGSSADSSCRYVSITSSPPAIARGEDAIDTFRRLDAALEPLLRQENAYWRGLEIPACVRR